MIKYWILFIFLTGVACKQSYNPPVKSIPTGYLVVEGFINSGTNPTTIRLTRNTKISDSVDIIYERGAQVQVEGNANDNFTLTESDNGVYTGTPQILNPSGQYHLHIRTSEGKEYYSDFESVKATPPIDSISWTQQNKGVQIYVNTHDAANQLKYYFWNYQETWEIHSAYASILKYVKDNRGQNIALDYRLPNGTYDSSIYRCWQSNASTSIFIGSSEKLSTDVIYQQPLNLVPAASIQLSVLYSINVKQFALGEKAYQFYQKLKTNTEQLGTIFDAQPSSIAGNIHCTSDPGEIVIGYVEVSAEQDRRLFIANSEVPQWGYNPGCVLTKLVNDPDSLLKAISFEPVAPFSQRGTTILTYFASENICVDCTLSGTNQKPDFWP